MHLLSSKLCLAPKQPAQTLMLCIMELLTGPFIGQKLESTPLPIRECSRGYSTLRVKVMMRFGGVQVSESVVSIIAFALDAAHPILMKSPYTWCVE
jgi:hypothetical protein